MNIEINKRNTVLFCCAGLGMGNASRTMAIIEEMERYNSSEKHFPEKIIIATWGAGLKFFQQYAKNSHRDINLYALKDYANWYKYPGIYFINSLIIFDLIKKHKPKLVVIDSDYHFLPFLFSKIKILSISQAPNVIERAIENHYQPTNLFERLAFLIREKLDSRIQLMIADKVLVPCFRVNQSKNTQKAIQIPLIVRSEFLSKSFVIPHAKIGILLSGSGIEKEHFLNLQESQALNIISPDRKADDFICHSNEIDKFEIIFTQGGLSSISEAIARKKFLVVFPIKNHPEQINNAITVEKLGIGIRAELIQLKNFNAFENLIMLKKKQSRPIDVQCDGATIAASIINQEFSN